MSRISIALTLIVLLTASSGWAAGMEKHTGVIVAVDENKITIDEMGPWYGPSTQPKRHVFQRTPATKVIVAERSKEGSGGWPWAFSDQAAPSSDLQVGDFVTVTTEPQGARTVAREILTVRPGTHLDVPGSS